MKTKCLPRSPRSFGVRGKCAGDELDFSIELRSHFVNHSDSSLTPTADHAHLQSWFHISVAPFSTMHPDVSIGSDPLSSFFSQTALCDLYWKAGVGKTSVRFLLYCEKQYNRNNPLVKINLRKRFRHAIAWASRGFV